jgi:predicted transcriptional regulator
MKKLLFTLLLAAFILPFAAAQGKLEVGKKAPEWALPDASKQEFTMNSWPGKVLQINYVDPDNEDLNDKFNDAVEKAIDIDKIIDQNAYKGFGIVDLQSTRLPDGLVRAIAGRKAKRYNTTILFDSKGVLHESWGLPKDSYSVVIIDKKRIVRGIYNGKIADADIQGIIEMIVKLTKE